MRKVFETKTTPDGQRLPTQFERKKMLSEINKTHRNWKLALLKQNITEELKKECCLLWHNTSPSAIKEALRVGFQCRLVFTCVRSQIKIEGTHERSLVRVKVEPRALSLFKLSTFYLASILFTWLKFTCVNRRSQKRVSGNQPQWKSGVSYKTNH